MKKHIFLILTTLFFIILKATNLGIRLSDTNIYFNLTRLILGGKLIYKDLFFANFPFFTFVSSFYYLLTFKNIVLFYFTSVVEIAIIALLIYHITYNKTKDYFVSLTSFCLYLFSFIILSTSDHQTGISTASLLAVLGFYFLQKERFLISGGFVALSILTKAYFAPVLLSVLCSLILQKDWKKIRSFTLGLIITSFVVLLPFLIQAPKQLISDIWGFSLTRPAGTLKTEVAWFFITKDFLLLILLLFNLINFRKNLFFALVSFFSILFFLSYQDIYYLYLNFLIPFLCLSFYQFNDFIKRVLHPQRFVVPSLISIFLLSNLFIYITNYRDLQKVNNFDQIISSIKKEKPSFLYGVNDLTPALLAITKIPALSNINDAHVYFFRRGVYDKKIITKQIISTKTILVTHGATYPEFNIRQDILDAEILDKGTIYKYCRIILSTPVQAEGVTNRINLFKCY